MSFSFRYVECDIPEGCTIREWRRGDLPSVIETPFPGDSLDAARRTAAGVSSSSHASPEMRSGGPLQTIVRSLLVGWKR